ncbi:MAG TPA: heat-inducible transcriptional repressor HrcA [Acidimicrobiales bacterium]|jgi:heat-inducible transcriptional repressor|nr:heat-inducible transcriptional repressor HrcA [Acidimicrobiales bacterium]
MTAPADPAVPIDADAEERALNDRRAAILEAVVTEYIGTAEPVGSSHVASAPGVQVSSATVRSEMVALERDGYLVQPHTSAGRIPTDKGYRFFVDHLTEPGVLGPTQHQQVSLFFDQVHGEMETMLERATGLLSELTSYTAVVVGPSHDSATIRSAQVVGLAPRLALLVVVLSDGAVDKRTIELEAEVSDDVLTRAGAQLHAHMVGKTSSSSWAVPSSGNNDVDRVVAAAGTAFGLMEHSMESDQIFVGGPARLAQSFDAVETVRSVLGILEQQLVVVSLLRDVLNRGLSVAIGTEHGFEPLASCAVVVAPVSVDGQELGAVGLLGPTRMDYQRALASAHVVGERLGQRLGESGRSGAPAGTGSHDGRN